MIHETIKEINGWKSTTVPDLKIGSLFLFKDEPDDTQCHRVVDIFKANDNIIIEYIPEWTPVRTAGMYHYGTKEIKLKDKAPN